MEEKIKAKHEGWRPRSLNQDAKSGAGNGNQDFRCLRKQGLAYPTSSRKSAWLFFSFSPSKQQAGSVITKASTNLFNLSNVQPNTRYIKPKDGSSEDIQFAQNLVYAFPNLRNHMCYLSRRLRLQDINTISVLLYILRSLIQGWKEKEK